MSSKKAPTGNGNGSSTAKKWITKEQQLANLVRGLHPIQAAILSKLIKDVVNEKKLIIESSDGEAKKFDLGIVTHHDYLRLAEVVEAQLTES